MKLVPQGHTEKSWGIDIIWANNEHYCGRILVFNESGQKTPMLLHKERRKSWFVNAGKFKITFIDVKDGNTKEAVLDQGQTVDIAEMSPHQLESLTANSIMLESGSPLFENDDFRISPDIDQKRTLGK